MPLPLPEINDASAYDKMPGIGPDAKGIHHWCARLPLPTAHAILFASTVDNPEAHPEKWPSEDEQNAERERLFDILRRMMGKHPAESPCQCFGSSLRIGSVQRKHKRQWNLHFRSAA
jgi:putative DNA methylase